MELSNSNIEKFLILQETDTPRKILIFSQKIDFLIFQKTEAIIFFLYFNKPNFLIFQQEPPKPQRPKFIILLQKRVRKKS